MHDRYAEHYEAASLDALTVGRGDAVVEEAARLVAEHGSPEVLGGRNATSCCPQAQSASSAANPDGGSADVEEDGSVNDHRFCRLSVEGELELAGPPAALRALGRLLRQHADPIEVRITGGVVAQVETEGPLLVSLEGDATVRFSGGRQCLDIIWNALEGVAEQAETAEDRAVRRHQHIESLGEDDEYRSPESIPLVIVADWPDEPGQTTR